MPILTREIHGITAETLREYLTRLGGEIQPDGIMAGQNWNARIHQMPDYRLGNASFCCFLVEIKGTQGVVENIMRQFDLRIMRPGG